MMAVRSFPDAAGAQGVLAGRSYIYDIALALLWFAWTTFGANLTGLFSSEYADAPWSLGKVLDLLKHFWVPLP